jgi:3-phosphoshikimate 1-carboxyvinyltransferase
VSIPTELEIGGIRPLRGRLRVPGDKSISHRALIFAAFADGNSTVTHLAPGDDVRATRAALDVLGVRMRERDGALSMASGGIGSWREPDSVLDCRNSGTTMRVMCGALAGRPFLTVLTGDDSLRQRPMGRVAKPLREMGAMVDCLRSAHRERAGENRARARRASGERRDDHRVARAESRSHRTHAGRARRAPRG